MLRLQGFRRQLGFRVYGGSKSAKPSLDILKCWKANAQLNAGSSEGSREADARRTVWPIVRGFGERFDILPTS